MIRKTKIICTIGPAVSSENRIQELIEAGMDVARINFSHGTHEEHQVIIERLKRAREISQKPLAIMLDTKGPEIRMGKIKSNSIYVKKGDRTLLVGEPIEGDTERFSINPGFVVKDLKEGIQILFDDGYVSSHVVEITPEGAVIEFDNEGLLKTSKGVNIPNVKINLPAMTDRDKEDITFGCNEEVDLIAASFIRSAEAVLEVKKFLDQKGGSNIQVIAKIENGEGVENFDSIIQVADGVMIARGDLGVEVPLSQVPRLQKMMIRRSYMTGKSSVTATQMLESMINNPRPTRAEVSDVANAIYDGTSAVMLSGETAIGNYPVEAVQMMQKIINEAEKDFNYRMLFEQHASMKYHDVPSAVTLASVKTAYSSGAKAIFAFTNSGSTSRLLSRLRPEMPIIAFTPNHRSYHQLALNWGVKPILSETYTTYTEAFIHLSDMAEKMDYVVTGDLVVVTAGSPFGVSGTTNTMVVENIGEVLVRGKSLWGKKIHSNLMMVLSPEQRHPYQVRGQIIVLTKCNEEYVPLINEACGVILQNHVDDRESEKFLKKIARDLKKPAIAQADGACTVLKEGALVTLDAEKGLIYKGAKNF